MSNEEGKQTKGSADEDTIRRCFRTEELRAIEQEGQPPKIVGLLVPYGALSEDMGGFREQFAAGAFSHSLASGKDIFANVEHDENKKLARTSNGTLSLRETRQGIRTEIILPDTTVGRDTLEEVRSGILDAMSPSFKEVQATWDGAADQIVRTIRSATLTAVALTSYPAFPQTAGTVTERSLAAYTAEIAAGKGQHGEADGEIEKLRKRLDLDEAMMDVPE